MTPAETIPPDDDLLSEAYSRGVDAASPDRRGAGPAGGLRRALLPRAAAVLALLAGIDVVLRLALPPETLLPYMQGEPAAYTLKVQRFSSAPAPDVLVLGSSRARDAVVPSLLAADLEQLWGRPARVFNLGLMNAKAEEWRALIRSHLPDPPPPYVIIATGGAEVVRPNQFQFASRFLWRLPDLADYLGRVSYDEFQVNHVEYFLESALCRVWYLFGQRHALKALALDRLEDLWGTSPVGAELATRDLKRQRIADFVLAKDGYQPPTGLRPKGLQRLVRNDRRAIHVPPRDLDVVPELAVGPRFDLVRAAVADLQARGCRVALAEAPPSPYLESLNPALHGDFLRRRLLVLATELGIPFLPVPPGRNYLIDGLFLDVNHMTELGAQRYTKLLFRGLREVGFFEP